MKTISNSYKEITTHHTGSDLNESLMVIAIDEVGPGGAHHDYLIREQVATLPLIPGVRIQFQTGALREEGFNGISDESLIAVVIDRLQGFQSGPFTCKENAWALEYMQLALAWLQERTKDRVAREVEGLSKP